MSPSSPGEQSGRPAQRYAALERANEIRLARAELKRRIRSGEIFPASVLLELPEEARTWEAGEFVMAQRRWAQTRTRRLLGRLQIRETKQLGAMTERQRLLLADALKASPGGRGRLDG